MKKLFTVPLGLLGAASFLAAVPPRVVPQAPNSPLRAAASPVANAPIVVVPAQRRIFVRPAIVATPTATPAAKFVTRRSVTSMVTSKSYDTTTFDGYVESLGPTLYYPLDDTTLAIYDRSGNALVGGGFGTFFESSPTLVADRSTAVRLDGSTALIQNASGTTLKGIGYQPVYTQAVVEHQDNVWRGGPLLAENRNGGKLSTSVNFALYKADTGEYGLYFYDTVGTLYKWKTVNKYNDGKAHLVAATVNFTGYTNGTLTGPVAGSDVTATISVSTSSGSVDQSKTTFKLANSVGTSTITTHFNIGGANMSGGGGPTESYWTGTVQKAALYEQELTLAEIAQMVKLMSSSAPEPTPTPAAVVSTQYFVSHIGFDTHFNRTNDPYGLANVPDRVGQLGFKFALRDSTNNAATQYLLTNYGLQHIAGFSNLSSQTNPTAVVENEIAALGGPSAIEYAEGTNEADSGGGTGWVTADNNDQIALWNAIKNNPNHPEFASIKVLTTSLVYPSDAQYIAPQAPYADYVNTHDSSGCNETPENGNYLGSGLDQYRAVFGNKPIVTTEFQVPDGQSFEATPDCKNSDSMNARYEMRSFAYRIGFQHEYAVTQFMAVDMPEDPIFGMSGVIDRYGNYKPQAYAVRTMLGVLPKTGSGGNCSTNYSIDKGATTNVYAFPLYDAATCRHYTMLWNAAQSGPYPSNSATLPLAPAYPLATPISGDATVALPAGDTEAYWGYYTDNTYTSVTWVKLLVASGHVTLSGPYSVYDQVGILVSDKGTSWTPPAPLPTIAP